MNEETLQMLLNTHNTLSQVVKTTQNQISQITELLSKYDPKWVASNESLVTTAKFLQITQKNGVKSSLQEARLLKAAQ